MLRIWPAGLVDDFVEQPRQPGRVGELADRVARVRLQAWLEKTPPGCWSDPPYSEYRQLLIRCRFPIDYETRSIGVPVDIDLHVALSARAGDLKFDELPVRLEPHELVRLAMKSAALWSLLSVAEESRVVADLCQEESKKPGGAARGYLAHARP